MISPIRVLLPLVFLLTFAASPGFVKAPIQENIERLTISQDSYIVPITNPSFPIKTLSLSITMGIDTEVARVIMCESGGQHEGVWGDHGKAYGIAQFWEKTFYWLADLAQLKDPDWYNREQQIYLLEWGIENGYGYLWTCY